MKNRDYKDIAPGTFLHIYNRGNNKEKIFFDEQDYKAFLFRFGLALGFDEKELSKEKLLSLPYSRVRITEVNKNDFRLHTFCLMPNHFHLLTEQCGDTSISKILSKVCTSYAMYINKKYKRVGHIFQERFKSVVIEDDQQLMWTSAYIHMNPIKDRIAKSPEMYKWSSYSDYIGNRNLPIISRDLLLGLFGDNKTFEKETLNFLSREGAMSRTVLDMFGYNFILF